MSTAKNEPLCFIHGDPENTCGGCANDAIKEASRAIPAERKLEAYTYCLLSLLASEPGQYMGVGYDLIQWVTYANGDHHEAALMTQAIPAMFPELFNYTKKSGVHNSSVFAGCDNKN